MKSGLPGWPSGIALESELWAVSSNLSEDNRIQATHLRLVHDLSLKCVIVKLQNFCFPITAQWETSLLGSDSDLHFDR